MASAWALFETALRILDDGSATAGPFAALTREHGGWPQVYLRANDERSRVQCLVLSGLRGGARHWTKAAPRFTSPRKRRREQVILWFPDNFTCLPFEERFLNKAIATW